MKKLVLAMLAFGFVSANAADAYEWDNSGTPTFSNQKPENVQENDLNTINGSPTQLSEPNVKQQLSQVNTMRDENVDNIKEQDQYIREHEMMLQSDRMQEENGQNGCYGGMNGMMGGGMGAYTDMYYDNASRGGSRWCLPTETMQYGMMGGYI